MMDPPGTGEHRVRKLNVVDEKTDGGGILENF